MNTLSKTFIITFLSIFILGSFALAGSIGNLTQFQSGDEASSTDMNNNFNAVKTAVNDNNSKIGTNTTSIGTNTTSIDTKQNRVFKLNYCQIIYENNQ